MRTRTKSIDIHFSQGNAVKKAFYFYTETNNGDKDFLAVFYMMLHALEFTNHYGSWRTPECLKAVSVGEVAFHDYIEANGKVVFAKKGNTSFVCELVESRF